MMKGLSDGFPLLTSGKCSRRSEVSSIRIAGDRSSPVQDTYLFTEVRNSEQANEHQYTPQLRSQQSLTITSPCLDRKVSQTVSYGMQ